MGERNRTVLAALALLAFVVALGFVLRRRDAIQDRRQANALKFMYVLDRQYREGQALQFGAEQGNLNEVRRRLPDVKPDQVPKIIDGAAIADQVAVLEYIFDHGYPADHLGNGPYLLSVAAAFGYTDLARLLERRHVGLHATDRQEALVWAAARGHAETVHWLLDTGVEVDAPAGVHPVPAYAGLTPLMLAANYAHTDVVRLLLQRHAGVNRKTASGKTALTFARHPELPAIDLTGIDYYKRVLPRRAETHKEQVDRTDDPATVVKLLQRAGGI